MCQQCDTERVRLWGLTLPPLEERLVPYGSGEAAIYSPEYLARKEGNAKGAEPAQWRRLVP